MASRKQMTEGEKLAAARIRKERADRGLTKSGEQSKRPGRTVPKATRDAAKKEAAKRAREATKDEAVQEVGGREEPLSKQIAADKPVSTGTSFEMDPEYSKGSEAEPTGQSLTNLAEGFDKLGIAFDTAPVELMRQQHAKKLYGERMLPEREIRSRAARQAASAARKQFKLRENPLPITADEAIRDQSTFTDTTENFAGREVNVSGRVVTADPAGMVEAYKDRKTGEIHTRTVPRPNVVQPERPRSVDTRARRLANEAAQAVGATKALTALEKARGRKTVATGEVVEDKVNTGAGIGGKVTPVARKERRGQLRSEALRSDVLSDEERAEIQKYVKATDITEFSDIASKRKSRIPADIVGSVGTEAEQEAFFKRAAALGEATDPDRIKSGETGQISDTGAITYTDSLGNVVHTDQLRQYGGAPLTENMHPDDAANLVRRIKGNKRGSEINPFISEKAAQSRGRTQSVVVDPDTDEILSQDTTARLREFIGKGANPTQRAAREQQVLERSGTSVRKDQETEIYRAGAGGKSLREEVQQNWAPYRDALKGLSAAYAKTTPEGQAELSRRAGGEGFKGDLPPTLKSAGGKAKSKPETEMTVNEAIRQYSIREGTRRLTERSMTDFLGRGASQESLKFRKGPAGSNVMRRDAGGVRLSPDQTKAAPTDLDLAEMQVTQPRLAYNLDRTRGGARKSGKIPKGRKGGKSNKEPVLSYAPGVVNDETIDWAKSTKPLVGSGGKEIASQTTLGGGKLSVQFQTPRGPQRGSAFIIDAPSVDPSTVAPGSSYPGVPGKRVSSKPKAWYSEETRFATPEAIKRAAMSKYRGTGMAIARQQQADRTMESPSAAKSRMAGEASRRTNIEKEESRRVGSLNKTLTSPRSPGGLERAALSPQLASAAKETAEMTAALQKSKYEASGRVVDRRKPEDELRSNLFAGPKKMYIKDPDNPGSFKQILESDYKGPQ